MPGGGNPKSGEVTSVGVCQDGHGIVLVVMHVQFERRDTPGVSLVSSCLHEDVLPVDLIIQGVEPPRFVCLRSTTERLLKLADPLVHVLRPLRTTWTASRLLSRAIAAVTVEGALDMVVEVVMVVLAELEVVVLLVVVLAHSPLSS